MKRLKSCLTALFLLTPASGLLADELPIIDAHSQADPQIGFEEILELMDEARVSRTILALRGRRKPEELLAFAARHADRITPAVRSKGGPYNKNKLQKFKKFLKKRLKMPGFAAMAEVLMYHAEKRSRGGKVIAPQIVVHPDDPRVRFVLAKAIKRNWPFIAHIEFASIGADRSLFMAKFEDMLRQNPGHPFVLIHMGMLPFKEVKRLLETHRNIHFIPAHSNPISVSLSREPLVNLFEGDSLAPQWKELYLRHPDRFILGFDNVWAKHWRDLYVDQVALWRKALGELPDTVAHAVAHGNAERLWNLPPAR
ncbi:MAG: amidohydrolase family protein, partial [Alphaproteobacteria bacterium]